MSAFDLSEMAKELSHIDTDSSNIDMAEVIVTCGMDGANSYVEGHGYGTPQKGYKQSLKLFSPRFRPYTPSKGIHHARRQLFEKAVKSGKKIDMEDVGGQDERMEYNDSDGFMHEDAVPMICQEAEISEDAVSRQSLKHNASETAKSHQQDTHQPPELKAEQMASTNDDYFADALPTQVDEDLKQVEPVVTIDGDSKATSIPDDIYSERDAEDYYGSDNDIDHEYNSEGELVWIDKNEDVY